MGKPKIYALLLAVISGRCLHAQQDTLAGAAEVVIAASKWAQKINEVPNYIIKIRQQDIQAGQPQTAADMLQQSGKVYVQKSQLAGGSPMIRGFATNRILLSVDGIRMNNAIFRSGNLQNVISIDPLTLQQTEVVFGPGTMVYGSDAIGGVLSFNTYQPDLQLAGQKGMRVKGNALARYSSAAQEQTYHAHVSAGTQQWGYLGSISFSSFDDLKMGIHGGQDSYLRPEYVIRVQNRDSVVKNNDPRKQVFSGYDQWNVLQKIRFKASEGLDLQYGFYFGQTGTAPRYDRLIEYRNGLPRFAEWNYGPMIWRMHTLSANFSQSNRLFDKARLVAGYQLYEESRIDRARNTVNRRKQAEKVTQWTFNFDANKQLGTGTLFYGAEYVDNLVKSTAWSDQIISGNRTAGAARYPNGSIWRTLGAYAMYKQDIVKNITLQAGLRYNYGTVQAAFSKEFIPFPYEAANLKDGAPTGSIGIAWRLAKGWQMHGLVNTGFRIPNIDDMGKLFETAPGMVVVPNTELGSEYAWNYEAGMAKEKKGKYKIEFTWFYTRLTNAIVRRPASFNGQDSIPLNGIMSRVESLQNIGLATVWGLQLGADAQLFKNISGYLNANYTTGRETDDVKNEQVPLRHAPPFFGNAGLRWQKNGFRVEGFAFYNGAITHENLAPSERQKPLIYARDELGRPYAPAWYTLNLRGGYTWKQATIHLAWENITNQRYRTYSSGIVAAGSNVVLALQYTFL